ADRYADHIGSRARRLALLVGELAMRRRRRMQDERSRVADIGEVRPELAALDDFDAGLVATLDAEGEDRAGPAREIFPRQRMKGARFETGIPDPGHLAMAIEKLGDLLRIGDMTLHPQGQRLDTRQNHESVERRERGTKVAERHGARLHGVAEVAKGLIESQ